ncbi:3-isopropylmalate dehydratase large subunit [Hibiscus syriacus]|uniref:3-isopropylmalate dehydratase large subunit n=1 Tax=Hibiscus syriacus TaxID=106335 RepID=A0A6A3BM70_HIBSY|nr:3-isopropylmalate dehydratase large subunit [Hibiscus syriacus]
MAPRQSEREPDTTGSVKTRMTVTEKILARASGKPQLNPGDNVWVNVAILMTHDVGGPGSIGIFKKEFAENAKVWDLVKVVIIPDHYIFTSDERANRNVDILRDFCTEQNIKYFYDVKILVILRQTLIIKEYAMLHLPKRVTAGLPTITTEMQNFNSCARLWSWYYLLSPPSGFTREGFSHLHFRSIRSFATGIGHTDAGFVLVTGKLMLKNTPSRIEGVKKEVDDVCGILDSGPWGPAIENALSSLNKKAQPGLVIGVLGEMRVAGFGPSSNTCIELVVSCVKSQKLREAFDIIQTLRRFKFRPPFSAYTTLIGALSAV